MPRPIIVPWGRLSRDRWVVRLLLRPLLVLAFLDRQALLRLSILKRFHFLLMLPVELRPLRLGRRLLLSLLMPGLQLGTFLRMTRVDGRELFRVTGREIGRDSRRGRLGRWRIRLPGRYIRR
jgi:hypothetical protein